ncbi:hypothetical protein [Raoultibacter massiliensis]|nr:hypothetical protein [Raoultibacter massiliensis]
MKKVTLPGMTEFSEINLLFLSFYRDARDIFFDDVAIESVYGGFSGSRWCGGRNNFGPLSDIGKIRNLISMYNELGVGCNATFTNQYVDAAAIEDDAYSRQIAEALAASSPVRNGVIIFSNEVNAYVKSNHPQLIRVSSTTKEIESKEAIEQELAGFDRVVLSYNLTKDEGFIRELSRPDKIEVMVNEYCMLRCPFRKVHYSKTSEDQVKGRPSGFTCKHEASPQAYGFLQGLLYGDAFLRNEDASRYSKDLNIEHFKIVGRGLARYDIVDSYLYYLVKPEHWYEVRDYLIHRNYL